RTRPSAYVHPKPGGTLLDYPFRGRRAPGAQAVSVEAQPRANRARTVRRSSSEGDGAEAAVDDPPVPRHNIRESLDVIEIGMEIHDARAEHVSPAYHCVGDEELAAALQHIEQRFIQRVQVLFYRAVATQGLQISGHIAERRDAERLSHQLEIGVAL